MPIRNIHLIVSQTLSKTHIAFGLLHLQYILLWQVTERHSLVSAIAMHKYQRQWQTNILLGISFILKTLYRKISN